MIDLKIAFNIRNFNKEILIYFKRIRIKNNAHIIHIYINIYQYLPLSD